MRQRYLLGIDIGTQGTKGVLFNEQGRPLATASRKSRLHQPSPGVVEEDADYQFRTVCQCIKSCVTEAGIDPSDLAVIGIDGQMAGIIGIGGDGRAVTPYDSWLDARCAPWIAHMKMQAGVEIIRKTGGPASFNHGPKILWWKNERSATYERIASFVQPGGYAAMRLCEMDASQAFIDKSYLHFSGFADNRRGCWDESLCREFDISLARLPRIVDSHSVIGSVTAAMARRCGLSAGTPVIAGCGDTAASFLSCGATREGICVDVAGTASVFAATTQQFAADTTYQTLGWGQSATPGLWHPYAYINGGGMNLEWFGSQMTPLGKTSPEKTLATLNRLASRIVPSPADPVFIPHLGGRVAPSQPLLRGSWAGLNWSHSAAHLYRAALEGVALEYCVYRDVLLAVNPALKIGEVRITGGGERSDLWNQMKADALQVPVVQINRHEGAPMGVALLAGYGAGLWKNLDRAASEWLRTGERFRPQRKFAEHYALRLNRYRRLMELLQQWAEPAGEPLS